MRDSPLLLACSSEICATCDRDAVFYAVADFEFYSGALARGRVEGHDVAQVDGGVLLDASALLITLGRTDVFPHAVDSFNHNAIFAGEDAQDFAYFALIDSGDDHDLVAAFNMSCHNE